VNEEGYQEILDFFVGRQESTFGWQEMLQQLKDFSISCYALKWLKLKNVKKQNNNLRGTMFPKVLNETWYK
jgi:hypothetical protein